MTAAAVTLAQAGLPAEFYLRLLISFAASCGVALTLYLSARRGRDMAFSYLMFGLVIFLIAYVLKSTEVSIGFGFGLFAVFGILRYRTEEVPTRELTFLLMVIAIAMINAVANVGTTGLLLFNLLLVGSAALTQWLSNLRREEQQQLIYERVELIRPDRRADLLSDLHARLGVRIERLEVGQIDYLRDTVLLSVWYRTPRPAVAVMAQPIPTQPVVTQHTATQHTATQPPGSLLDKQD